MEDMVPSIEVRTFDDAKRSQNKEANVLDNEGSMCMKQIRLISGILLNPPFITTPSMRLTSWGKRAAVEPSRFVIYQNKIKFLL